MTSPIEIKIPDLGGADAVEVIEVLVKIGDFIEVDDILLSLESDKASMDIPSPLSGKIKNIALSVGDNVNEGDVILTLSAQENTSKADADNSKPQENTFEKQPPVTEDKNNSISTENNNTLKKSKKLIVIGAGPGGYTAAFRAADLGMQVTLIERYNELGGVCLNVGCIPSKALLHSASVISQAREMEAHGVIFNKPKIDINKLRGFKESVIKKLTSGLSSMAKARGVNIIHGSAEFSGTHSLIIKPSDNKTHSQTEISFDTAIIAAGSRVSIPPIFDIDDERIIDSTGALQLKKIPSSMLIIGGGIIGLEMATIYSELGCEVTIVEFMNQIIPGADKDIVQPLSKRMKPLVKEIMLNTKVTKLSPQKSGIKAFFAPSNSDQSNKNQTYEYVLVATGRKPNTDRLMIEKAKLFSDENGFILTNKKMQTSQSHIFAIGDIASQPMLAHKATHEAKVAAEVAAGLKSGFDTTIIPSVAYTDPEIAWAGLTETQAKKDGIAFKTASFPWVASGRAIGNSRTEGKTKLLFDPETHRIIGGAIVGQNAGELIAEIALAIEMGSDASDISLTIHPHPTLSETIAMAAEVYEGTITDLYIPKK